VDELKLREVLHARHDVHTEQHQLPDRRVLPENNGYAIHRDVPNTCMNVYISSLLNFYYLVFYVVKFYNSYMCCYKTPCYLHCLCRGCTRGRRRVPGMAE